MMGKERKKEIREKEREMRKEKWEREREKERNYWNLHQAFSLSYRELILHHRVDPLTQRKQCFLLLLFSRLLPKIFYGLVTIMYRFSIHVCLFSLNLFSFVRSLFIYFPMFLLFIIISFFFFYFVFVFCFWFLFLPLFFVFLLGFVFWVSKLLLSNYHLAFPSIVPKPLDHTLYFHFIKKQISIIFKFNSLCSLSFQINFYFFSCFFFNCWKLFSTYILKIDVCYFRIAFFEVLTFVSLAFQF